MATLHVGPDREDVVEFPFTLSDGAAYTSIDLNGSATVCSKNRNHTEEVIWNHVYNYGDRPRRLWVMRRANY